jgi:hypothetical protein
MYSRTLPWGALPLFCLLAACQSYDAPPEVTLATTEDGTIIEGQPLELLFSEPIQASSLTVAIYPTELTQEGDLAPGVVAQVEGCTAATSPCGETTLEVAEDGLSATLVPGSQVGPLGSPLLLEVGAGLSDQGGNAWAIPQQLSFQISPDPAQVSDEPVQVQSGVYVLLAETTEPLPVVIRILTDVTVLEDGQMRMAGAKGAIVEGAARNSVIPEEMFVDEGESGFGVFIQGNVVAREGERFLNTDPFSVDLTVLGIRVVMSGLLLTGKVVTNEETGDDELTGTLSFEQLLLYTTDNPIEFNREQVPPVPFLGRFIPADQVPAGTPELCGELCGTVTVQCVPPESFPGDGFCQ